MSYRRLGAPGVTELAATMGLLAGLSEHMSTKPGECCRCCGKVRALPMTHYWRLKKWLGERYGHRCRVICRGGGRGVGKFRSPVNVLVEFGDGSRVVGTRFCVRRLR